MQGIVVVSYLRPGTPEQQSAAIFYPAVTGVMILEQRRNHSIVPQLGTYHNSWHVVHRDIGLKVGKMMLVRSLLPLEFWEHKTVAKFLPQLKPLVLRLCIGELMLGSSCVGLFFTYLSRIV